MPDILLLGATGFTGFLTAEYLVKHPQRTSKFTLAISARSQSKLDELKRRLALDDSVQLLLLDVTQPDQVEVAVKTAKVIINVVGPYYRWGEPVLRACALHGKHYVDLSGESHWVLPMIRKYDYLASKTGAIIVPTCGFDSVPADMLVFLANKTAKSVAGPDAQLGHSLTVYDAQGGISGGTFNSIFTMVEQVPLKDVIASSVDYALSTAIKGPPTPKAGLYYTVPFTSPPKFGAMWPMAGSNRQTVQRTWGLHALASLSAPTLSARAHREDVQRRIYGPQFTYDECMLLPGLTSSRIPAILFNITLTLFGVLLYALSPFRQLVKRLVPQPGGGPSEEAMKNGYLEATNYTDCIPSTGGAPIHIKTVMRGQGDPGYSLTAVMLAESGLGLLLDQSLLPPLARSGGLLTPASALGEVLVRRLEATERVQFESRVISPDDIEGNKKSL